MGSKWNVKSDKQEYKWKRSQKKKQLYLNRNLNIICGEELELLYEKICKSYTDSNKSEKKKKKKKPLKEHFNNTETQYFNLMHNVGTNAGIL